MWNLPATIPLLALLASAALALAIARRCSETRAARLLLGILLLVSLWSFASFMIHTTALPSSLFWFHVIFWCAALVMALGVHFASEFPRRGHGPAWIVGAYYLMNAALLALYFSGGMVESVRLLSGGIVEMTFGPLIPVAWTMTMVGIGVSIWLLMRVLWGHFAAEEKNRTLHPLVGFIILLLGVLSNTVVSAYPVDVAANVVFVGLLSYAVVKGRLLRPVARELRYLFIFACLWEGILVYGALVVVLWQWLALDIVTAGVIAAVNVFVVAALLARSLRQPAQRWLARRLFPTTFRYWDALAEIGAADISLSKWEDYLAQLLDVELRATHATTAVLFLAQENSGYFVPRVARGANQEAILKLKLPRESPFVSWLVERNELLTAHDIQQRPQFAALLESERALITVCGLALFCGVRTAAGLIGIIALGRQSPHSRFTDEDLDFCRLVTRSAARTISNVLDYAEAQERSRTDWLTGLYNHRSFQERLQDEIDRCLRYGMPFSILMCDVDRFKAFNDLHGHQSGDEALRAVAGAIRSSLRKVDTAFRYGGDEFACLLPVAGAEEARSVAERLLSGVSNIRPPEIAKLPPPFTLSVGVACFPQDGVLREQVVAAADAALLEAKREGGNRVCVFAGTSPEERVSGGLERLVRASDTGLGALYALVTAVEAKDSYTFAHSDGVARCAVAIGESLGLGEELLRDLRVAGLLHDIGKIGVPDRILNKAGQLTEEEWSSIRGHPTQGARIVRNVTGLAGIVPLVLHHHEHFDGCGYPYGIGGDSIPLGARIVCVADSYAAMVSQRPYRAALTHDQAVRELQSGAGRQYDPTVVRALFDAFSRGHISPYSESTPETRTR